MGRKGWPVEFRRRALDLVAAGRPITDVARDLDISSQSILRWQWQDRIDECLEPGTTSAEAAELAAAKRRIVQLEAELTIANKAVDMLTEATDPKGRFAAIRVMAAEGLPVKTACRMLEVTCGGYYAWLVRPPSERSIRHAWLTDEIRKMLRFQRPLTHADSRQRYGARRFHAELRLGSGIDVGRGQIELLMQHAGLKGLSGCRKWRRTPSFATVVDLVERQFERGAPDELRVTDITEHPTREGKLCCAVVLDTFSRRVVGWSIDSSPTAALVTNALGMAIDARAPRGTIIHSDQGTQFTSWAFTRRALDSGLVPSVGSVGDCYDNGMIEPFWSRMQVELLDTRRWKRRVELANAIFEYLKAWHNRRRRHSALGMLTPDEFETRHRTTTVA